MPPILQQQSLGGPGMLAITLILTIPSALALFASYTLTHGGLYYASALWFVYEISFYLGIFGAVLAGILTVTAAARHRISSAFVYLMGIATIAAVALAWYAAHIYRSPWAS